MPFGNLLSEAAVVATGEYGSIYTFNLSSVYAKEITQATLASGVSFLTPLSAPIANTTLFSYLQSESAPDYAYSFAGNTLYLFINSDYNSTARIGFEYLRNAIKPVNTASYLDIPEESKQLFLALLETKIGEIPGERIGFELEQRIINEKTLLGL